MARLHVTGNISRCRVKCSLKRDHDCVCGVSSNGSLPPVARFLRVYRCLKMAPDRFFSAKIRGPTLLRATVRRLGGLGSSSVVLVVTRVHHLMGSWGVGEPIFPLKGANLFMDSGRTVMT